MNVVICHGTLSSGRGVMGAQLVDTLASYVDRWIVGSQLSAAALGIYQQAYTINHNLGHLVVFVPVRRDDL